VFCVSGAFVLYSFSFSNNNDDSGNDDDDDDDDHDDNNNINNININAVADNNINVDDAVITAKATARVQSDQSQVVRSRSSLKPTEWSNKNYRLSPKQFTFIMLLTLYK